MTHALPVVAALTALLAGPGSAETHTYSMMLGNRQLGTLVFNGSGSNVSLLSTMDNTPLGVADGTFEAVTRAKGDVVSYHGRNRGSKSRDIEVIRQGSTVTAVTVTPDKESTELTDAAKVPIGVISPTEMFAALANGGTCPPPLTMYDGRRVVQMATTAMKQNADTVICDMSYRVVMGPGHLSPFRFKSFGMQIAYSDRKLARITLSAGGFSVNLVSQ